MLFVDDGVVCVVELFVGCFWFGEQGVQMVVESVGVVVEFGEFDVVVYWVD